MNVFIDSTGTMYFGDERETARNCPHCHAFSRMSPTALPTFDELLLQKPRSIGLGQFDRYLQVLHAVRGEGSTFYGIFFGHDDG